MPGGPIGQALTPELCSLVYYMALDFEILQTNYISMWSRARTDPDSGSQYLSRPNPVSKYDKDGP